MVNRGLAETSFKRPLPLFVGDLKMYFDHPRLFEISVTCSLPSFKALKPEFISQLPLM